MMSTRLGGSVDAPCAAHAVRVAAPSLVLAALVLALGATEAIAGSTRQCSDPCLQAGRAEFRDCVSSASGAFADALGSCLGHDRECVDACLTGRQDCRDATTLGGDLVACDLELAAAKASCRNSFPLGSTRRAICIDHAETAGFQCRRTARRRVLGELRACRSDFLQCAGACAPGEPVEGVQACRSERKDDFKAAVAGCKRVHQATASGCINKDVACVQDCAEARGLCTDPTSAILNAAIASCSAQRAAELSACAAANPAGTPGLQSCVDTAQANAFACRQAALTASEPGFAACTGQYVACLQACPAG
jgi:hypothetical protein